MGEGITVDCHLEVTQGHTFWHPSTDRMRLYTVQGPRRVQKSGGQTGPRRAWEREPITGVWGQSPQRGSRGQSPQWGVRGRSPPEANEVFVFKTPIFNAVLHEIMYCLSCFFCKISK